LEYSVNGSGFTNDLSPAPGTQTATMANIATIHVAMGVGGNDRLGQNLDVFAFDATVNPDGGDTLQTDISLRDRASNHTIAVSVTGTELIDFIGVGGDDNLFLTPGIGDHQ